MSVKKVLLWGLSGAMAVSMTSALAGGFSPTPMPAAPVVESGYYFEGDVGYGFQDYKNNVVWADVTGSGTNTNSSGKGGFSGGLALGYQINNNVALELGWFQLPSVNVNQGGEPKAWMKSFSLYLAAKFITPLKGKMDAFFKAGLAYRSAYIPTNATFASGLTSRHTDFLRPMFGAGLAYHVCQGLSVLMQYHYFMGANNSFTTQPSAGDPSSLGTVAANELTAGLAYQFTL